MQKAIFSLLIVPFLMGCLKGSGNGDARLPSVVPVPSWMQNDFVMYPGMGDSVVPSHVDGDVFYFTYYTRRPYPGDTSRPQDADVAFLADST